MRGAASRLLSALALNAVLAVGQLSSSTMTDANTGITFLNFAGKTGYSFGLAMPKNPSTDFIVQMSSPLDSGKGWVGIDFGQTMTGHLLVVAWPNGNNVMLSPRIASDYDASSTGVYSGNVTLTPIAKGTFANSTHITATFICSNCINSDSFKSSDSSSTFGYGYSTLAVKNPSDSSTLLSDHSSCCPYGSFPVTLSQAQSSDYSKWAALAGGSGGSSGTDNTTASSTSTSTGSTASQTSTTSSSSSSGIDPSLLTSKSQLPALEMGPAGVMILVVVGFLYVLQGFNFF